MKTDFNKSFVKAKKVAADAPFVSVRLGYGGDVTLKIGCESDFAVYDNGEFVFSGAYSAPYGSVAYDCFEFSGKGFLDLYFCEFPRGSSIYKSGNPMFIYELTDENGNVFAFSDEGNDVFYREDVFYPDYAITAQIGWSFAYDLSAKPQKSVKTVLSANESLLLPRPVKKCFFTKKVGAMLEKGDFVFNGGKTPAEKIEKASLVVVADRAISLKKGQYAVFDLGEETTGQIFFDITAGNSEKNTAGTAAENTAVNTAGNVVYIGYGEDFKGRVHAYINGRNFAFSYKLNGGENKFVQPFGRTGGRYLVVFSLCDISVREIGVSEIGYPVTKRELAFKDPLDQKIYDVAVRTNYLCMHSHYEDCPWREQAFYGMDAALQMKYAYEFFGETTFPRENLRLFYSTRREDGLFDLCAPSEIGTTIPSFSLFAAMVLADYYDFSGDEKFVFEMKGTIEKLLDAFAKKLDKGLIARFSEKKYWNFYEWKTDLDGGDIFRNEDQEPIIDLPTDELKITVFGDSISTGMEANGEGNAYFYRFRKKIIDKYGKKVKITNKSVIGDSTAEGMSRFETAFADDDSDMVIVAFGMNDQNIFGDFLPVTPEIFGKNLKFMGEKLIEKGKKVVFVTPCVPNDKWVYCSGKIGEYADIVRRTAKDLGCPYADANLLWNENLAAGKRSEDLLSNGINHPADYGHYLYYLALKQLI